MYELKSELKGNKIYTKGNMFKPLTDVYCWEAANNSKLK